MQYEGKIGDAFGEWLVDRFLAVSLDVNQAVEYQYAQENKIEVEEIPQIAHILEQHGIDKKTAISIDDDFGNFRTVLVESFFRQGFQDGFNLALYLLGIAPERQKGGYC